MLCQFLWFDKKNCLVCIIWQDRATKERTTKKKSKLYLQWYICIVQYMHLYRARHEHWNGLSHVHTTQYWHIVYNSLPKTLIYITYCFNSGMYFSMICHSIIYFAWMVYSCTFISPLFSVLQYAGHCSLNRPAGINKVFWVWFWIIDHYLHFQVSIADLLVA